MRTRGELPDTEVAEVPARQSRAVARRRARLLRRRHLARAGRQRIRHASWPVVRTSTCPTTDPTAGTGAERRDVVHRRVGIHRSAARARPADRPSTWPARCCACPGDSSSRAGIRAGLSGGLHGHLAGDGPAPLAAGADAGRHGSVRACRATPCSCPSTVPERVRALAKRITRWAPDRDAATRAVESYLREHATYRLDSPVPPPGADAVDHFLFVAHTGFCEQFAAAEVVLLRAAGVPARLATGFAGGESSGDHRTLRGSDAHAWVEVWYPDLGWAASDPTAGARRADVGLCRPDLVLAAGRRGRGSSSRAACWRRWPSGRCRCGGWRRRTRRAAARRGDRRRRSSAATGAGGLRPAATRPRRRGHAASAGRERGRAGATAGDARGRGCARRCRADVVRRPGTGGRRGGRRGTHARRARPVSSARTSAQPER